MNDDTIDVTMWDGSTYHGPIVARANTYVPWFLHPNSEIDRYLYYIRTEQLHHYASLLYHFPLIRPSNSNPHTPRHAFIKIGNNQLYSAMNFEAYDVNEHQHTNTSGGVGGNLPRPNHIYIKVSNRGVYRSVLQ